MSNEQEGVIKYQLNHTDNALQNDYSITDINAWRTVMARLQLIGQDEKRYGGYGFGNISQRLNADSSQFIISGTQTGELAVLNTKHYCLVTTAIPQENKINSIGACKPSSEALTHASVYLQNKKIQAVIHAHCPEIWRNTLALNLPHTAKDVPYGTPEMAKAVDNLFDNENWQQNTVFTMLGHEDGVLAFGESLQQAASSLITQLSLAIAIEQG
ncbi:MAG: class II aldolase/adducin family protein [Methylococcaceae bacterium]|nr:class II aldolase/adducin family protein [Methylococcaceae bacterium]